MHFGKDYLGIVEILFATVPVLLYQKEKLEPPPVVWGLTDLTAVHCWMGSFLVGDAPRTLFNKPF